MAEKKLLFSVTAADCDWQDMTASGPGGQHRNRRHTAIRCTHRASGAVGFASEMKSQIMNKRAAFERMAQTKTFQNWHRLETARRMMNEQSIEQMINKAVDRAMEPVNIKVEVKDDGGKWTDTE